MLFFSVAGVGLLAGAHQLDGALDGGDVDRGGGDDGVGGRGDREAGGRRLRPRELGAAWRRSAAARCGSVGCSAAATGGASAAAWYRAAAGGSGATASACAGFDAGLRLRPSASPWPATWRRPSALALASACRLRLGVLLLPCRLSLPPAWIAGAGLGAGLAAAAACRNRIDVVGCGECGNRDRQQAGEREQPPSVRARIRADSRRSFAAVRIIAILAASYCVDKIDES